MSLESRVFLYWHYDVMAVFYVWKKGNAPRILYGNRNDLREVLWRIYRVY